MRIENIRKVFSICFEENVTPFVWGQHGIGKSQIVTCFSKFYKFIRIRFSEK